MVARGGTLVFCEVKTRRSDRFGVPAEAVTVAKQRRLRRIAAAFLAEHTGRHPTIRFDVVEVRVGDDGSTVLTRIEGAF